MLRWLDSRSGHLFVTLALLLGFVAPSLAAGGDVTLRSYYSGNGLLNRGLYDLAAVEYRKFLSATPEHTKAPVARYGLAYSHFQLGQYAEAVDELLVLDEVPDFEYGAEAALILGQSQLTLGAFDSATDAFAKVQREYAQHELVDDALALQAEAFYRGGRHDEVATPASRLVSQFPDSPHRERAELFWGLADMAREDFPAAVQRFDGMTTRFGTGAHADQTGLLLAQSLHRSNDVERALRQYQDVITRGNPEYTPDAQYGTALLLHQQDRTQHAGFFLDQLLDKYPGDPLVPDARLLRGRVFFDLDDFGPAAEQFQALANANDRHADEASYWLGKCDLRGNDPTRAAERLGDALQRYPESVLLAEMTYDQAVALLRADRPDEALAVLGNLRDRFPRHALAEDALHLLAVTTHSEGDLATSLVHCNAYAGEYPDGRFAAYVAFLGGENQFLAHDWESAAPAYEAFLTNFPGDEQADKARFRRGMALYQMNRFDDAVPELDRITDGARTSPAFIAALLALGDGYFQRGAWAQAEPYLEAYVGFGLTQGGADNALLKLGLCRHRLERLDDAVQSYDMLISSFGSGPHLQQAIFERGQALVTLERTDEAVEAFQRLLAEHPGTRFEVHALNHLGAIAMQRQEYEDASSYFNRVAATEGADTMTPEAIYQEGQALLAAEQFTEAGNAFSRLIREHPDSTRHHQAAALESIAVARDGNSEIALSLIEGVERDDARHLDDATMAAVIYEKAWCLRDLDRLDGAGEAYRTLLATGGEAGLHRSAMLELAELEFDDESYRSASDLLRRLRDTESATDDITPDLDERALYRLAVSQYQLDAFKEAAQLLEEFLRSYPQSESVPSASLFCGEAYMKSGSHQIAVEHLERVVTNFPDDDACEPSLLRLGECFASIQEFERSGQAFSDHRRRFPDSPLWYQAQFGIGWAHENRGDHDKAINAYQLVIERHEGATAARAQFQIGECLFAQRNYEAAARELVKVDILYAYPEWSAAALYEAGRCFQEMSNPVGAREQYERVVADHGTTKWSRLANERLTELGRTRLPGHQRVGN